jgi:hypothetical protein
MPQTLLLSTTERNWRPTWHKFQPQGRNKGLSTPYTVHNFCWPLLSFVAESSASWPQSGKAPYHSLPLPHLYIISVNLASVCQIVDVICPEAFCFPVGEVTSFVELLTFYLTTGTVCDDAPTLWFKSPYQF